MERILYCTLDGDMTERGHLKDVGIDKIILFKWIIETQDASYSGHRSVMSSCEHGNEFSSSIKEESVDELNDYWFGCPDINYQHYQLCYMK
jgi:hypothetical protein